MNNKQKYAMVTAVLGLLIGAPIWFYLLYKLLEAANASELMWFLYWIYLPVQILITIFGKISESCSDD